MTGDELAPLFGRPLSGGVFRTRATDDLDRRLSHAGWSVVALEPFEDRDGFYTEIASRLALPGYFGRNLDALWDSLRGVREPTAVIIPWQPFAERHPTSADRLLSVLTERAESPPPFAVILLSPFSFGAGCSPG